MLGNQTLIAVHRVQCMGFWELGEPKLCSPESPEGTVCQSVMQIYLHVNGSVVHGR